MDDHLQPGLYELLVTRGLEGHLAEEGVVPPEALDARTPDVLARHIATLVERVLNDLPQGTPPAVQATLINSLVRTLREASPKSFDGDDDDVVAPPRALQEVSGTRNVDGDLVHLERPTVPLSQSALFVNGRGEPGVGSELNKEIASADRVDVLIPFVRWTGVRIVRERLAEAVKRGARVRVIASTYLGSSEARALEALLELGAEVKISYDTTATRLHAKAWLFERESGFSTALIGSSNLSRTALLDGLEWNVRISAVDASVVLSTVRGTFETYWHDDHVEPYDADRFRRAIKAEKPDDILDVSLFDLHALPHQRRILEALDAERTRHDQHRNLVVAATGTGKTVVAALDYRRLRAERGGQMSLLFIAHRREILDQSRRTFRAALKDGTFGERYVDGERPTEWQHVFASVQALAARGLHGIEPDRFDMVIVDEFHHGAAPTYRTLLDFLQPQELLGLTATPERTDGQDQEILDTFFGGRFAAELRLWDAIDGVMLCPFQYFGVHDDVDLSRLEWKRGGYDSSALENVYTGNDARVAKVLASIRDIVQDPAQMRALGFCVSVAHAQYMAASFRAAGIPAVAVSGESTSRERERALIDLRAGRVNCVFAVDIFNEGVDVPEVDTVLFLRPTESATIFLQQLGRGLRRTDGKACLTVIDFIGNQHKKFRFDRRLRALLPTKGRADLTRQIEDDFPFLPSGCFMTFDRVARDVVLDNIKASIRGGWREMVSDLRDLGDVDLATFLRESQRDLDDLYRGTRKGWMQLRREAGLSAPAPGPDDEALARAIGRLTHIDDPDRLDRYRAMLAELAPPAVVHLSKPDARRLTMFHFGLWGVKKDGPSLAAGFSRLWAAASARDELAQVLALVDGQASVVAHPFALLPDAPLKIHAAYSRDEILAAVGASSVERPLPGFQAGVLWSEPSACDVFLVTLDKDPKHFSADTQYKDYAISSTLFHWESQGTTAQQSPTGQRYVHHRERGTHVLLFIRPRKGQAYTFAGPATYVSHQGERPIEFVWRLERALPEAIYTEARKVA